MVLSVSFACTVYFTVSQAAWVAAAGSRVAVGGGSWVGVGRGTLNFLTNRQVCARAIQVVQRDYPGHGGIIQAGNGAAAVACLDGVFDWR